MINVYYKGNDTTKGFEIKCINCKKIGCKLIDEHLSKVSTFFVKVVVFQHICLSWLI